MSAQCFPREIVSLVFARLSMFEFVSENIETVWKTKLAISLGSSIKCCLTNTDFFSDTK